MFQFLRTFLICTAMTLSATVVAAQDPLDLSRLEMPTAMRASIKKSPSEQLARHVRSLHTFTRDGALTGQTRDKLLQKEIARLRASLLGKWLVWDLDGDLIISSQEAQNAHADGNSLRDLFSQADQDFNGSLSTEELRVFAAHQAQIDLSKTALAQSLATVMAFDVNQDERVDVIEMTQVVLAIVDQPLPSRPGPDLPAMHLQKCSFPAAPGRTQAVIVTTRKGAALSNVAVAGQDTATTVARVDIAPDGPPLYVVLKARTPVIWQFQGETSRIQRVLIGTQAAVSGLQSERVTVIDAAHCLPNHRGRPGAPDTTRVQNVLLKDSNIAEVRSIDQREVTVLDLQAGRDLQQVAPIPRYPRRKRRLQVKSGAEYRPATVAEVAVIRLEQSLRLSHPAGLLELDWSEVFPAVEPYKTMPSEIGMITLIKSGAIEPRDTYYLVTQDIPRVPIQSGKNYHYRFHLADNIAVPSGGGPGRPIFRDSTGECLTVPYCN